VGLTHPGWFKPTRGFVTAFMEDHRRRRRGGGAGSARAPLKFGEIFSGNYYVKFGHFSGKKSCKIRFGNFVNFSGKNHVKFGHFINFSYIFFSVKNVLPPKVD